MHFIDDNDLLIVDELTLSIRCVTINTKLMTKYFKGNIYISAHDFNSAYIF